MRARPIALVFWSAATLLALAAAVLLARDALAIPAHVPLDPNEGWNAFHAMSAMAGHGLYPPPDSFMVNNYPPLSFYVVGVLGNVTGDFIIAGRLVSLFSFLAVTASIPALLRMMDCGLRAALFAALFFAAALLIASDYVAMDDPQLLGHAVQVAGLLLLFRGKHLPATALFVVSLFIKHNLLAMPLAAALWLPLQNRRDGLGFIATGLGFGILGLVAFRLIAGSDLPAHLLSARISSLANYRHAASRFLSFAALPIVVTVGLRLPAGRQVWFCRLYGAVALALGLIFASGDGVDINVFFDAIIALSLLIGLALERRPDLVALTTALPLLIFLFFKSSDDNFPFTPGFARQARQDIAFLKARSGPALCDELSLCYWAGKPASVDVFNVSESFRTGARDESALAGLIAARHFSAIEVETLEPFALGRQVRAALLAQYRIDHADDIGVFLVPRQSTIE